MMRELDGEMSGEGEGGGGAGEEEDWWTEELETALASLMPGEDPLCRRDWDVTAHINALFPTEQSLSRLDETMLSVRGEMDGLDEEIGELVEAGVGAGKEGAEALAQAHHAIQELFTRIREIKAKTDLSESMVKEMTRDIKQLDVAKRNLTTSITTLNHLHMLLSGLASLEGLVSGRRYAEMANLLPGLLKVLDHFARYMAVPQVSQLAAEVQALQEQIKTQVAEDLKDSLTGAKGLAGMTEALEICRVVSVVDSGELRSELSGWYINTKMAEYVVLFEDTQDQAWLDSIDKRYSWFRQRLVEFEESSGHLFPVEWEMGRRMTREFCARTRAMLQAVMGKREAELEVKLLLHAIQRTKAFEALLCKRFPGKPRPRLLSTSADASPKQSQSSPKESPKTAEPAVPARNEFDGCISRVFEPQLGIYVRAQDTNLSAFLEQATRKVKEGDGVPRLEAAAVAQPLPSSGELFLFFKRTIVQVNEITTEPAALLGQVIPVLKRQLREYGVKVLSGSLPRIGVAAASLGSTSGLLQSLLREGEAPGRLSAEETFLVCCVLVTAEFCAETSGQLEAKLSERLSGPGAADLGPEVAAFHGVTTAALSLLIQDLESGCEAALVTMSKMNWSAVDSVGDESPYVASIKAHLLKTLPPIRDHLANARRYFLNLCGKFATNLCGKYLAAILRLRSLSAVAAEQLLLDTAALRGFLLQLPTMDSLAAAKPPSVYTKPLTKAVAQVEAVLKLVSLDADPEALVVQYVKLVPEHSAAQLGRILELKGVRRSEQSAFVDAYRASGRGRESTEAPSLPSLAGPLLALAGDTKDAGNSSIRRLERLVKGIHK